MRYFIDTNVFVESKNTYFGFDICPGFWAWLSQTPQIGSIDRIKGELLAGKDELAVWVEKILPAHFFIPSDEKIQSSYREIAKGITNATQYSSAAKMEFLAAADGWLIAAARVFGMSIITHEKYEPQSKKKIKIPNVAMAYNIKCVDIYTVLRLEKVQFR